MKLLSFYSVFNVNESKTIGEIKKCLKFYIKEKDIEFLLMARFCIAESCLAAEQLL